MRGAAGRPVAGPAAWVAGDLAATSSVWSPRVWRRVGGPAPPPGVFVARCVAGGRAGGCCGAGGAGV